MPDEPGELSERIARLRDEELLRMVGADAADYRREARDCAEEELRRRGVPFVPESREAAKPAQVWRAPQTPEAGAYAARRGVGGWLLFFCVGLTVVAPLLTVTVFALSYLAFGSYFTLLPALFNFMLLDGLLSAGVMILSIQAGVKLWSVKPGAVRTAKSFLVIYLCYSIVAVLLPLMVGLPPEVNRAFAQKTPGILARSVVFFSIWFTYLSVSRRVKATYGDEVDGEP